MPTYEYFCPSCNKTIEIIHKASEPDIKICPECSKSGLKRKISKVGLSFQGSGFYITDYGRNSTGGCDKPGGCGCKKQPTEQKPE